MELNINKTNILEFNLLVEGTSDPIKEARFSILTSPIISFSGKFDNGKLLFEMDNLKKFFHEGDYNCKVEVFIDNSCFTTYEGNVSIKAPLQIKSSLVESKNSNNEPKISIQFTETENKIQPKEEKPIKKGIFNKFLEGED